MDNGYSIEPAPFLSVSQVAAQLGVHHRTVRRWIKAGLLSAVRVGGVLRIAQSEFRRFIRAAQECAEREPESKVVE